MFKKKLSIKILETIQVFIAINYRLRYCLLIIILTLKQCILFLLMLERMIWIGQNILQKNQTLKYYKIYYLQLIQIFLYFVKQTKTILACKLMK